VKLNGGLDALISVGKRLWVLWIAMAAVIAWGLTVNQSVVATTGLGSEVHDIHVEVKAGNRYMRDSLVTDSDQRFILGQLLAQYRSVDNRLRKLEHRPIQEGVGRWQYYPEYGSMPEKYRLWFEPPVASEWLERKASGQ